MSASEECLPEVNSPHENVIRIAGHSYGDIAVPRGAHAVLGDIFYEGSEIGGNSGFPQADAYNAILGLDVDGELPTPVRFYHYGDLYARTTNLNLTSRRDTLRQYIRALYSADNRTSLSQAGSVAKHGFLLGVPVPVHVLKSLIENINDDGSYDFEGPGSERIIHVDEQEIYHDSFRTNDDTASETEEANTTRLSSDSGVDVTSDPAPAPTHFTRIEASSLTVPTRNLDGIGPGTTAAASNNAQTQSSTTVVWTSLGPSTSTHRPPTYPCDAIVDPELAQHEKKSPRWAHMTNLSGNQNSQNLKLTLWRDCVDLQDTIGNSTTCQKLLAEGFETLGEHARRPHKGGVG
ncbi:hypothetical protein LTR66_016227 [Elasticomyces elasticus]|nr:hypothetical protein LTR66_016227 [Elasticomyces elasticus]